MSEWVPIVFIALGIAVWFDASRLGMQFGPGTPGGAFSPWGWGLVVALVPVIFMPAYGVARYRFVRRPAAAETPAPT